MRHSRNEIREPEIADYFFGRELILSPLKTVPIEDGQYRFETFVAVGDGENYIGLGQRCGKDRKSAEQFAFRNNLNITEAKRCFATHDEDESWLDECRKIVYIQSHAYIFNSSTLFNNVPMAQWSTLMPCNREAAGSNLSGVLAFI